jgi:hypothetical protein
MFAPENLATVMVLAREAGKLVDAASAKLGIGGDGASTTPSTVEMAEALAAFHFPDDLWARLVYDLVICARSAEPPIESLVAALVPIYFGRVGSFIIENRHQTTEQAEDRVERQAREFELLKPYLVDRWEAAVAAAAAAPVGAAAGPTSSRTSANGAKPSASSAAAKPKPDRPASAGPTR